MFEKFNFSLAQINKYHQAAVRDFSIIKLNSAPEIIFVICYQVIIKEAVAICAKNMAACLLHVKKPIIIGIFAKI